MSHNSTFYTELCREDANCAGPNQVCDQETSTCVCAPEYVEINGVCTGKSCHLQYTTVSF